jgi:hypothetical protein
MKMWLICFLLFVSTFVVAQEEHDHPVPEKLGKVSFPTTCTPAVQPKFERAVALLHSFAYAPAEQEFYDVVKDDPNCAIARWGVAMSYYHQLWEPPITPVNLAKGQAELEAAQKIEKVSDRERAYISALRAFYEDYEKTPNDVRAKAYAQRMKEVAVANANDNEAQVFYALALLGTASMLDKTHANQKQAAAILEPLYVKYPDHPGIAHYLIHSYDSTELAKNGLAAARAYSKIAPSAPHALHMPSHIFTRLGLWDDSISSNLAARAAAHTQGDVGEELHAMDYLVYAYLQRGRDQDAAKVIADMNAMAALRTADFKIGYAASAMPVRYAVERKNWDEAAKLQPRFGSTPQVAAITQWARAISFARSGKPELAATEIQNLKSSEDQLLAAGNKYWAGQVHVQTLEAEAWKADAEQKYAQAVLLLRNAADQEDAVEKLPVTPGPIVPAREQLAELLLLQKKPSDALREFEESLKSAPVRRAALEGAARCAELLGDQQKAKQYRAGL